MINIITARGSGWLCHAGPPDSREHKLAAKVAELEALELLARYAINGANESLYISYTTQVVEQATEQLEAFLSDPLTLALQDPGTAEAMRVLLEELPEIVVIGTLGEGLVPPSTNGDHVLRAIAARAAQAKREAENAAADEVYG